MWTIGAFRKILPTIFFICQQQSVYCTSRFILFKFGEFRYIQPMASRMITEAVNIHYTPFLKAHEKIIDIFKSATPASVLIIESKGNRFAWKVCDHEVDGLDCGKKKIQNEYAFLQKQKAPFTKVYETRECGGFWGFSMPYHQIPTLRACLDKPLTTLYLPSILDTLKRDFWQQATSKPDLEFVTRNLVEKTLRRLDALEKLSSKCPSDLAWFPKQIAFKWVILNGIVCQNPREILSHWSTSQSVISALMPHRVGAGHGDFSPANMLIDLSNAAEPVTLIDPHGINIKPGDRSPTLDCSKLAWYLHGAFEIRTGKVYAVTAVSGDILCNNPSDISRVAAYDDLCHWAYSAALFQTEQHPVWNIPQRLAMMAALYDLLETNNRAHMGEWQQAATFWVVGTQRINALHQHINPAKT